MSEDKKIDKTVVYYILGGAALGAIAGYIVKKVGMKNVINVLKAKNIIPENVVESITDFAKKAKEAASDDAFTDE